MPRNFHPVVHVSSREFFKLGEFIFLCKYESNAFKKYIQI